MNYYNDNEPFVCEWLTNLIAHGLIPPGMVDCRSITDVKSKDLRGYTQCHFFAGIAGWPLAFQIAGWPNDRPVWSASCPCPPFSVAGKQTGCPECQSKDIIWDPGTTGQAVCSDCDYEWFADARHLWPEVWRLAAECRPRHIFGEQVASRQGLEWLAGVRGSMEILGYAVGATDLPAASVGAPHIRQRLWWTTSPRDEAGGMGNPGHGSRPTRSEGSQHEPQKSVEPWPARASTPGGMGNPNSDGRQPGVIARAAAGHGSATEPTGDVHSLGVGNTTVCGVRPCDGTPGPRFEPERETGGSGRGNAWDGSRFIPCGDGKARRVEPSIQPLADGVSQRVGRLSAYGNSIVPQVAAAFIGVYLNDVQL